MKDNDGKGVVGLIGGLAIGLMIGVTIGQIQKDEEWRKSAITNNFAEWRIDPKTGETEFVWLTVEENK